MEEQVRLFGFGSPTGIDLPYEFGGALPSKALKKQLADDMSLFISPIKQKIDEISGNDEMLGKIAKMGAEKARDSASKTIATAREMIGFTKFY